MVGSISFKFMFSYIFIEVFAHTGGTSFVIIIIIVLFWDRDIHYNMVVRHRVGII